MKTRTDFVSNSSSCSFVISTENGMLSDAVSFFAKTFSDYDFPYSAEESITVTCWAKNKWFVELESALSSEESGWKDYYSDWQTGKISKKDPEEVGYDGIRTTFGKLTETTRETSEKIEELEFRCEDCDETGLIYLKLLYFFFERNGFCPDDSKSEHDFLTNDSDDFMTKLATARVNGNERNA